MPVRESRSARGTYCIAAQYRRVGRAKQSLTGLRSQAELAELGNERSETIWNESLENWHRATVCDWHSWQRWST